MPRPALRKIHSRYSAGNSMRPSASNRAAAWSRWAASDPAPNKAVITASALSAVGIGRIQSPLTRCRHASAGTKARRARFDQAAAGLAERLSGSGIADRLGFLGQRDELGLIAG